MVLDTCIGAVSAWSLILIGPLLVSRFQKSSMPGANSGWGGFTTFNFQLFYSASQIRAVE
jgi:hypothetical protein